MRRRPAGQADTCSADADTVTMYLLRHRRSGHAPPRPPVERQRSFAAAAALPALAELPKYSSFSAHSTSSTTTTPTGPAEGSRLPLTAAEESRRFDAYMCWLKLWLALLAGVCVSIGLYALVGNQKLRKGLERFWGTSD